MAGKLAEDYKDGNLSDILSETPNHWAVGKKIEKKEKLVPVTEYTSAQLVGKEIIEQNGSRFVKEIEEKQTYGYKIFRD
jgi:hypothetical protein